VKRSSTLILLLVPLVSGCITLDTDVPIRQCPHGDRRPIAATLPDGCRSEVEAALASETAFDGFVAMQGDQVLMRWGDVTTPTNVASVRKSIISLLYGIAQERGLVDVDATLAELAIDDAAQPLTALERQATVRDLLQARSGIYLETLGEPSSWRAVKPERGSFEPGERFYYNNWDFNALGTIFEQTTGLTLELAFEEWLAEPLGMQTYCPSHVTYEDASFTEHAMYRFYLSADDLALIGALVLARGDWEGEQLVPESWIDETTARVSDASVAREGLYYTHYGYLWWVDEEGRVWADGSGPQFVVIDPEADLVTVFRNQTGNSVPGRLWHGLAQDEADDSLVTNSVASRIHDRLETCR